MATPTSGITQVKGITAVTGSGGSSISLTTTGTSGVATLISDVLNIPDYSSGSPTVNLGADETHCNPQISGDATSGLFNYLAPGFVGIATSGAPVAIFGAAGGSKIIQLYGTLSITQNDNSLPASAHAVNLNGLLFGAGTYDSGGGLFFTDSTTIAIGTYTNSATAGPLANVLVGQGNGFSITTGDHNTAIGAQSGFTISTGSGNTILGAGNGNTLDTGSNNILIGTNATADVASGSDSNLLIISGGITPVISATNIDSTPAVSIPGLAGTGTRAVLADTNGLLSAPVSDAAVKENITPVEHGLDTILSLNPVSFDYIEKYKNLGTERQHGFIAQEMQQVVPEIVFKTPSTGLLGINNVDPLIAVLVKAIQEQQVQIDELKKLLGL